MRVISSLWSFSETVNISELNIFVDRTKMAEDMKKLEEENSNLKEGLLDAQCRSMKNNLIFTGLSEQEGENCEGLLRDFLYYENFF
jgi:hypothetical protein